MLSCAKMKVVYFIRWVRDVPRGYARHYLPSKVIYYGVLSTGRVQLDLQYYNNQKSPFDNSFSNIFTLFQLETKKPSFYKQCWPEIVSIQNFFFWKIEITYLSSNGFVVTTPQQITLNLQLNFTRIVCSHEHYVALNLPSSNPAAASVTFDLYSGASSPTPSVRSNDSQSSFISHLTEKTHWAELTPEFKRRHFLVGLVLSQLSSAFENS